MSEKETTVPTDLKVRASASLQQEVEDELSKPDPSPEQAKASLAKILEDQDSD